MEGCGNGSLMEVVMVVEVIVVVIVLEVVVEYKWWR